MSNRFRLLSAAAGLSACFFLSACDNGPSEGGIATVINESLEGQRFCLRVGSMPVERAMFGQQDLEALVDGGLLELLEGRVEGVFGKVAVFDLTDMVRQDYDATTGSLCYAGMEVEKVVNFTEPRTDARGREVTTARWRGRLVKPAARAKNDAFQEILGMADSRVRTAEFEVVLANTNNGWKPDPMQTGMKEWHPGTKPVADGRRASMIAADLRAQRDRELDLERDVEDYQSWMKALDAIAVEVGVTGTEGRSFAETFRHANPKMSTLIDLGDFNRVVTNYDERMDSDPKLKRMAYACTGFVEMTLALERCRAWDAGEEAPEVFGNGFSAEELSWMADKVGTFKHSEACLKAQKPNLG